MKDFEGIAEETRESVGDYHALIIDSLHLATFVKIANILLALNISNRD